MFFDNVLNYVKNLKLVIMTVMVINIRKHDGHHHMQEHDGHRMPEHDGHDMQEHDGHHMQEHDSHHM